MELYEKVVAGNLRAASRLMRLCDDDFEGNVDQMKALYPHTGKAAIIGVTGNPGSGKSTLVDRMIARYRKQGCRVGVVAIDPTSPFSGGAIMGDRLRMENHFTDEEVFIRSLATRGHLGGLSKSTGEIIRVMEAWGADPVIVETVGVGQAEVDVAKMAHTSIVVMVPGLGDEIQAIKAGLMEIADVFVVNKADREGCERTYNDVQTMLEMVHPQGDDPWQPRVLKTIAFKDEGIDEVVDAVQAHRDWLIKTGQLEKRKRQNAELQFFDLLYDAFNQKVQGMLASDEYRDWRERLAQREMDPYSLVEDLKHRLIVDPS